MNSDGSDEEVDINENDRNIPEKFHSEFISGWENDDEGIEEEEHPHETPEKEILWAAENGNAELVRKLLSIDGNLTKCVDKDGYTPLHRAAYSNHLDVLNVLLEYGADYNAETIDKWTPLHSACRWNSALCVEKLLSLEVNVNAQSLGGITPLHLAAGNNQNSEIIQALLLHPAINTKIKSKSNETAYEIAYRSGKFARFFEIAEPCFTYV